MDAINLVAPTSSRGELAPLFSTIAPLQISFVCSIFRRRMIPPFEPFPDLNIDLDLLANSYIYYSKPATTSVGL
jgi:hypothetical protein